MLLAPGLMPSIPAYTVKVHAKFPGQDPAIQGVIVLHDLVSGPPRDHGLDVHYGGTHGGRSRRAHL
jgi:hypothetical protein